MAMLAPSMAIIWSMAREVSSEAQHRRVQSALQTSCYESKPHQAEV